jgi:hypothetical protein
LRGPGVEFLALVDREEDALGGRPLPPLQLLLRGVDQVGEGRPLPTCAAAPPGPGPWHRVATGG